MRWNSSFISLSNNEEIFFQYDVESLHIYAVAVHSWEVKNTKVLEFNPARKPEKAKVGG